MALREIGMIVRACTKPELVGKCVCVFVCLWVGLVCDRYDEEFTAAMMYKIETEYKFLTYC